MSYRLQNLSRPAYVIGRKQVDKTSPSSTVSFPGALQVACRLRNGVGRWLLVALCVLVGQVDCSLAEEIQQKQSNGPVTVTTTLAPSDPTIGDEVTLHIEAVAEPDVELLMPEFDEVISGFPIAEWIPKQTIQADGSTLQSVQYRFQVTVSGEKSIPPILIEFIDRRPGQTPTPKDMDAYEILTERIDFQVKSVLLKGATSDLAPPLPTLELPSASGNSSNWCWLTAIPCIAGGVLAAIIWRRRRKTIRKANAYELAQSRMEKLLARWRDPNAQVTAEAFFVEISSVIRRYLEDRYELRAPELTTDEFLQLASQEKVLSQAQQSMLSEFLTQADVVKFAGVEATEHDVQRSTQLAQNFLEQTRPDALGPDATGPDATDQNAMSPQVVDDPRQFRAASRIPQGAKVQEEIGVRPSDQTSNEDDDLRWRPSNFGDSNVLSDVSPANNEASVEQHGKESRDA